MSEYKTISVPSEVKKRLKKAKGEKEWGDFLSDLYEEAEREKRKQAFKKLAEEISTEELDKVIESSQEFRGRFELR